MWLGISREINCFNFRNLSELIGKIRAGRRGGTGAKGM
jgi:hypothetical protein